VAILTRLELFCHLFFEVALHPLFVALHPLFVALHPLFVAFKKYKPLKNLLIAGKNKGRGNLTNKTKQDKTRTLGILWITAVDKQEISHQKADRF